MTTVVVLTKVLVVVPIVVVVNIDVVVVSSRPDQARPGQARLCSVGQLLCSVAANCKIVPICRHYRENLCRADRDHCGSQGSRTLQTKALVLNKSENSK